jgi:DNA end-binding protein Ku
MKPIWQGTLSFGLVTIPVGLYSAIEEHSLSFTLLCETCNNPITYKRWCNHCRKEVSWDHITKGLKLKKDTYFILTQEQLQTLKPTKTETIALEEFIDPALIDPIYLEKHYYIAPKKSGEKAYFLFVEALRESHKVAIGVFVMRDKEHVCVIFPYKESLLLTTLNYAYEIKDMDALETLKTIPKIKPDELKLAMKLIEMQTKKKFDITKLKDHFAERLEAVVKKGKGKTKLLSEEKPRKITHDASLLTTLRASLEKPKAKTRAVKDATIKKRTSIKASAKKK